MAEGGAAAGADTRGLKRMIAATELLNKLNADDQSMADECGYYGRICRSCSAHKCDYGIKFTDRCLLMVALCFINIRNDYFYEYKKVLTWH
jgi:uncharacterized radical SAM superfamily Fe-S cluster-containing enzyme